MLERREHEEEGGVSRVSMETVIKDALRKTSRRTVRWKQAVKICLKLDLRLRHAPNLRPSPASPALTDKPSKGDNQHSAQRKP